MATNVANVNDVTKVLVVQGDLPEHVGVEPVVGLGGQVNPAAAIQPQSVAVGLDEAAVPVLTNDIDGANAVHVEAAKVLGQGGRDERTEQEKREFHVD